MGAPKTLHVHNVPTKTESIWHLEELARKYAEWVAAQRQKSESGDPGFFKFEKGDPSEAVLENVGEVEESSGEEGRSDASSDSDADADGSLDEGPPPSEVAEEDEDDPTQVRPSARIARRRPHRIPHHRRSVPARTTPRCSTTSPRTLSASSCPMSPVPLPTRSLTLPLPLPVSIIPRYQMTHPTPSRTTVLRAYPAFRRGLEMRDMASSAYPRISRPPRNAGYGIAYPRISRPPRNAGYGIERVSRIFSTL